VSSVAPAVLRGLRHPDETQVGRRAALSLILFLIAALTGAGLLLAHSIRRQQETQVSAHLGLVLQAALSEAAQEAERAQQQAATLAADPRLQQALAAGDRRTLERLTASVPGAAAVVGSTGVPESERPSLRREVHVLAGGSVVGTVAVTTALDGAALARFRTAAPLRAGEGLLFLRGSRVVSGPAALSSTRIPPHATTARLAGGHYRLAQARLIGGVQGLRLAALAPASEVEAPVARAERLLAACLFLTFVALLLLARLLARPVLIPLTRLAREARRSTIDELTRLPNRRGFAEAAAAELARAQRTGRPLAVALVDIDDFKRVNDTFGHPAGDRVLCGVADVLREHFRELDVPARLGGEEFAVLLPETDLPGACDAAERFVASLGERSFGDDRSGPRAITASAGVAFGAGIAVDELLATADRALYRAKEHGKNQVQAENAAGAHTAA
jgi:diguanylate cyclase (GGDEF)-like protein